jgi:hypothetical protein
LTGRADDKDLLVSHHSGDSPPLVIIVVSIGPTSPTFQLPRARP